MELGGKCGTMCHGSNLLGGEGVCAHLMLPPGMALRAFFLRLRSILLTPPCTAFVPPRLDAVKRGGDGSRGHVSKKLLAMNRSNPGLTGDLLCNALLLLFIAVVLVAATAVSLRQMFQANSAKASAQRALTDSFLRTIGLSQELSLDERAALWELTELAPENVQVRETVIDRWFQTEESVLRGLENDARGLRAASGLSVALWKRIMLRSKELSDRLVTVLEQPQQPDADRLSRLGEVIAALAARMDPPEAARTAARSAHVLVTALEKPKETDVSLSLGRTLGNLAKFLPGNPRATLLLALSNVFLEEIPAAPQQGQEEAQVRKEVTELCKLLIPQDLAEVLKWPFTVGEAEKIVLAELERQTGQTFGGNVWKFVEQAQNLGIKGLDAPAKQPHLGDMEPNRR